MYDHIPEYIYIQDCNKEIGTNYVMPIFFLNTHLKVIIKIYFVLQ